MIVIINGPLGIGKTQTSWELLYLFERGAMLDGDYIGAIHPFKIYDDERIANLYQAIYTLGAFHYEHGYRNLVINYVFEHPDSLAQLRRRLAKIDDEVYAFRLVCSEEEIARRIRQRGAEAAQLEWELQRFRQLVAIQERAADLGDLGYVVDSTGRTAQETARHIWEILHEAIELAPYNPAWPEQYAAERAQVAAALGPLALDIQHIGSTAVPGLCAKPVIDLLVTVPRLEDAAACIAPLRALGYAFIDYPANTERRFFRKGFPRTHHLHIVAASSQEAHDHIAFRDLLRCDPAQRDAYARLKESLAAQYSNHRAAYSAAKTAFIKQALKR